MMLDTSRSPQPSTAAGALFEVLQRLAHAPSTPRWTEPGANEASFQGRRVEGELVVDFEFGKSPVSGQWCLHVQIHRENVSLFHATGRGEGEPIVAPRSLSIHEGQAEDVLRCLQLLG